jgi:hypothetical protein
MDQYLEGKQLVLGRMGNENTFVHSIPNALMASVPGHPFWINVLEQIQENLDNKTLSVEAVCYLECNAIDDWT